MASKYVPAEGYKWNAVLIILKTGNRVLVLERAKHPNKGLFVPPGGKIEPFEDPTRAARRECEEETGQRLQALNFLGVINETSPTNYNWNTFVYWAEVQQFDPPLLDEGKLSWVNLDDVLELPAPATAAPMYAALRNHQQFVLEVCYDKDLRPIHLVDLLTGHQ